MQEGGDRNRDPTLIRKCSLNLVKIDAVPTFHKCKDKLQVLVREESRPARLIMERVERNTMVTLVGQCLVCKRLFDA